MAYDVDITSRAERDLTALYGIINAENSAGAFEWYEGLKDAILSLAHTPERCSITPENRHLRHLLYGKKPHVYRIIYRVEQSRRRVVIVHIRHGARRPFKR